MFLYVGFRKVKSIKCKSHKNSFSVEHFQYCSSYTPLTHCVDSNFAYTDISEDDAMSILYN
jgi:hypothetical protein